ncbi:hypothetical protein E9229_000341 [Paeniglutamicibacter cryotolerans]|uniref:Uncharacterized protein n=1 Tax=Paeniglutamicibacter cryotolerans TaxID=670079 RepID=A0A839QE13_9MICC|nr:hypothetical protein [Paeniglutamicibacter cryotolerans]
MFSLGPVRTRRIAVALTVLLVPAAGVTWMIRQAATPPSVDLGPGIVLGKGPLTPVPTPPGAGEATASAGPLLVPIHTQQGGSR